MVALTSVPSMAVTLVSATSRLGTASTSGPVFWLTSLIVVTIAAVLVSVPFRSRVLSTESGTPCNTGGTMSAVAAVQGEFSNKEGVGI